MERSPTAIGSSPPSDLIDRPFRLLNVDPSSTAQQISDAYVVARAQDAASQEALVRARDAILDTGQRLTHELAYPIGSTIEQVNCFYDRASSDRPSAELVNFADSLEPLSRANFLAHIAARRAVGSEELAALVGAHAAVDPNAIYDTLKRLRHQAGFSPPSLVNVGQELEQLFCRHAEVVLGKFDTSHQAAVALYKCTQTILAMGERHHIDSLSTFLEAYRRSTDAERSKAGAAIEHTCGDLQKHPDNVDAIESLTHVLTTWRALSEPLIALDVYRRHHDAGTEAVLDHIRALLANLSSNHHFTAARNIVDLACATFRSAPTAVAQFEQASQLLQKLASETELRKLNETITRALNDTNFLAAVKKDGFGPQSSQPALDLWRTFSRAVAATKSSEYADRPWASIHDFAVHLNDRPGSAPPVSIILSAIIQCAEDEAADPAFTEIFRAELRNLRVQNPAISNRRGNFKRFGGSALVVGLIIFGLAGAVMLYRNIEPAVLRVATPERSSHSTRASPAPDAEVIPPVGRGQRLALSSVRYCRFQEERLRVVKQRVKESEDIRAYNMLAGDYNSRCADFFFQDQDQKTVSDEIQAKKTMLEADAMRILATWPWHTTAGNASPAK